MKSAPVLIALSQSVFMSLASERLIKNRNTVDICWGWGEEGERIDTLPTFQEQMSFIFLFTAICLENRLLWISVSTQKHFTIAIEALTGFAALLQNRHHHVEKDILKRNNKILKALLKQRDRFWHSWAM